MKIIIAAISNDTFINKLYLDSFNHLEFKDFLLVESAEQVLGHHDVISQLLVVTLENVTLYRVHDESLVI